MKHFHKESINNKVNRRFFCDLFNFKNFNSIKKNRNTSDAVVAMRRDSVRLKIIKTSSLLIEHVMRTLLQY